MNRPDQQNEANRSNQIYQQNQSTQVNRMNPAAEFWPPPPGFPSNYTGIGVTAISVGSVKQKKPITWPLIIGLISLVIVVLGTIGAFSEQSKVTKDLDQDARANPLVEIGSGTLEQPEDAVFNMTVNGNVLKLSDQLYTGLTGDIDAAGAASPYYILAAYLPSTKQVVETQIYDKEGGKLLANFTDFPDSRTGYKPSLAGLYSDASFNFGFTLFIMALLLIVVAFCGRVVFKRLKD